MKNKVTLRALTSNKKAIRTLYKVYFYLLSCTSHFEMRLFFSRPLGNWGHPTESNIKSTERHCFYFYIYIFFITVIPHLFTKVAGGWWVGGAGKWRQPPSLFNGHFSGSASRRTVFSEFITVSITGQGNPGECEVLIWRAATRANGCEGAHTRAHAHCVRYLPTKRNVLTPYAAEYSIVCT